MIDQLLAKTVDLAGDVERYRQMNHDWLDQDSYEEQQDVLTHILVILGGIEYDLSELHRFKNPDT